MLLLSRFWFLILAIAAITGVAIAMVATRIVDERTEDTTRAELARDRFELDALLKIEARVRIDSIAPLATHPDVRSTLLAASGHQGEVEEAVASRLRTRLGELNSQLAEAAGDIVFAVDAQGYIIAQLGGTPPRQGAGLATFPLVRAALTGYVRDDVWIWNGEVLRMAARPVLEGGHFVGAVIHGKRVDDAFAQRLANRLTGASVGFYLRGAIIASAMPDGVQGAPRRDELATPIDAAMQTESYRTGEGFDPQSLASGGIGLYTAMVGEAGQSGAGHVVARPIPQLGSPTAILSLASSEDWGSLPWPLLGGGAAVLFILAILFTFLEHDRPLARFRAAAERFGKREVDRFDPAEHGGALRTAAQAINDGVDKALDQGGTQPRRKAQNLDDILGQAPASSQSSFFGGPAVEPSSPAMPAFAPPVAPAAPSASTTGANPRVGGPPLPGRPPPPAPGGKAPPPPPGGPPGAAPKLAIPKPGAPGPDAIAPSPTPAPAAAPMAAAPAAPPAVATPTPLIPPAGTPPESDGSDFDDGADDSTMVANIPQELIRRSGGNEEDDDAHFKATFEAYTKAKIECGESTAGLTYDKFVVQLKKTREKIVLQHGVGRVRFAVYVKDGKAALKATPVKT